MGEEIRVTSLASGLSAASTDPAEGTWLSLPFSFLPACVWSWSTIAASLPKAGFPTPQCFSWYPKRKKNWMGGTTQYLHTPHPLLAETALYFLQQKGFLLILLSQQPIFFYFKQEGRGCKTGEQGCCHIKRESFLFPRCQ